MNTSLDNTENIVINLKTFRYRIRLGSTFVNVLVRYHIVNGVFYIWQKYYATQTILSQFYRIDLIDTMVYK